MAVTTNALVSIIIPVYNGEKTIRRTINSCLEQTYANIEIIVVDNASTDRTKNIVESVQSDLIQYVYLPQKGRSLARNAGLDVCKGTYIQFLDADDLLEKNKLSFAVKLIEEKHVSAIQCATLYMREDKIVKKAYPYEDTRNYYMLLMTGNAIPINSILAKRDICKRFPEGVEYCEDWVFWLESLKNASIAVDREYCGAIVILHDENTMRDFRRMKDYELRVLLHYRKERLSLRYALIRTIKIYKRYLEYRILAEKDPLIESYVKGSAACAVIRMFSKIPVIQKTVEKITIPKNEAHS